MSLDKFKSADGAMSFVFEDLEENKTRIDFMKKVSKNSIEYRLLKKCWRIFLKSNEKINISSYKVWHRNGKSMSEKQMLVYLLSLDNRLKKTYEMYQDILYAVKEKKNYLCSV